MLIQYWLQYDTIYRVCKKAFMENQLIQDEVKADFALFNKKVLSKSVNLMCAISQVALLLGVFGRLFKYEE